jgi:hypothetical protein
MLQEIRVFMIGGWHDDGLGGKNLISLQILFFPKCSSKLVSLAAFELSLMGMTQTKLDGNS